MRENGELSGSPFRFAPSGIALFALFDLLRRLRRISDAGLAYDAQSICARAWWSAASLERGACSSTSRHETSIHQPDPCHAVFESKSSVND